jgi:hypothetical protein
MKKLILCLLLISPCFLFAQIGFKAGLNFANVSKASSINNSSRTGFHAGILLGGSKGIIGSRTELLFSRQGYDYKNGTNTGSVNLDYIMMPTSMSINITKYFSLMVGAQAAFLLNAKVDSTKGSTTGNPTADKIMDYYNRFDYGFGAGVEIHPVSGLLIGAKINISLAKLYKDAASGQMPSFSSIDMKNNLFQIFTGWRFGGGKSKKKDKEKDN